MLDWCFTGQQLLLIWCTTVFIIIKRAQSSSWTDTSSLAIILNSQILDEKHSQMQDFVEVRVGRSFASTYPCENKFWRE